MVGPQRYFPWKIARQYFISHFLFVFVTLILTGFSLRYFIYRNFVGSQNLQFVASFDQYLTSLFMLVLAIAALYLAISTNYYVRPLGHVIQKARRLRRLDVNRGEEFDLEELEEEPGEWNDLERALNRVHRELRTKTDALSREREELSALIGAVSDAILAVDRDGETLFFNSQFALLFPVAQQGQRALSLGEAFRVPEVLAGYREVLESGQRKVISASVHTAHHGGPRHFSISIAPLMDRQGQGVDGAIGIFHDVSELKQAEQIRIEFVGNASHELRTPLTSIKGYVETLRDDIKTNRLDGASQFIDIIGRNVDRLIFLVNDLLDLSTLESGADLKKTIVSTGEITETVLKQLENKRAAKGHQITTNINVDSVLADGRRLEQVLVNLIHNAIKYVPERGKIEISWEKAPPIAGTKSATILRVKDNGPGITPEHQGRLFGRFYRVDPGRSRDQGGTGLGLAIVKHIMIKHGGAVRLVSRPGQGSEFICTFPA